MSTLRAMRFTELFSVHGVLDDEQRPLGEHRAPQCLMNAAPTELRVCPYPGKRHKNVRTMNLSALRQTKRHWNQVLADLRTLRSVCGIRSDNLTLGELWRYTAAAAALPTFLLRRVQPVRELQAEVAVMYKACLGLKFLVEQRLLEEIRAHGAIDSKPIDYNLASYAEESGWLVGREEVCAATVTMIGEVFDAILHDHGPSPEHGVLRTLVDDVDKFGAFARASWGLYAVLLLYSAWTARRSGSSVVGSNPPPQNAFSLTLGMQRLVDGIRPLDDRGYGAALRAFATQFTAESDQTEVMRCCRSFERAEDQLECEELAAQHVEDFESRLNAALGRASRFAYERRTTGPDLSAYRSLVGSEP